jgi:UDP-N-acetylmuramate--alanine ligase
MRYTDYRLLEGSRHVSIHESALVREKRLHFMGIGGSGSSAMAQLLHAAGGHVNGCDRYCNAVTRGLEAAGIPVALGHATAHLAGNDALVVNPMVTAIDPHNGEIAAAQAAGIPVVLWQELLGQLMQGHCAISVAGAHGKGTTAALLARMLIDAGLDPTCLIGAELLDFGGKNYRLGKSGYFLNEADEFNHHFWFYHPRLAVITAIEFDHPEFFADDAAYLRAFMGFVRGMDMQGDWPLPPTLVLNRDSPGCQRLQETALHDWPGRLVTCGLDGPADLVATDMAFADETSFTVYRGEERIGRFRSPLPGRHNVANALAASAAALELGLNPAVLAGSLATFGGLHRRFEVRQAPDGVTFIDDYAHHPSALAVTIATARAGYPGRRLLAVFQPHLFSRTRLFLADYARVLGEADIAIISDIFPAREHDTGLIHARDLVAALPAGKGRYGGSVDETTALLRELLRPGDVALVLGAGDINQVTEDLLAHR